MDVSAFVKTGDVLFEIDVEQYEASRKLRYSEVRSAEAKVTVALAEVDRAERYFKRLESADDRGVTATERDTAETALASAKAALNAARAEVEQSKAAAAIAGGHSFAYISHQWTKDRPKYLDQCRQLAEKLKANGIRITTYSHIAE